MEKQRASSVKAMAALFSQKEEVIANLKPTPLSNIANNSHSKRGKARPAGFKPPIKTRKPVLQQKPQPRSRNSVENLNRSMNSLNSLDEGVDSNRSSQLYAGRSDSTNEHPSCGVRLFDIASVTRSQSHDSLNTTDSGVSVKLDTDQFLPVNNELYNVSLSDGTYVGDKQEEAMLKINLQKDAFKKELEKRLKNESTIVRKSSESPIDNDNNYLPMKYPRYKRILLPDKNQDMPPRKPILPPDVHIAICRQTNCDSSSAPPRRPPSRNSATSEPPALLPRASVNSRTTTSRLIPTRLSPPPPPPPPQFRNNQTSSKIDSYGLLLSKLPPPPGYGDDDNQLYSDAELPPVDNRCSYIPEYTEEEEMNDLEAAIASQNDFPDTYNDPASVPTTDNAPLLPPKPRCRPPEIPSDGQDPSASNPDDLYEDTALPTEEQISNGETSSRDQDRIVKENSKKMKKEREKREKEIAKTRKKFSLTGNERPLDSGNVKETMRGNRNNLSVKKGEYVVILRMENNPTGKWLAQNENGKIGYVDLTNIEVDPESVKSVMKNHLNSKFYHDDTEDELYDDIEHRFDDDDEAAIYEETG